MWYPSLEGGRKLSFAEYLDYKNELKKPELLNKLSLGIGGSDAVFPEDSLELLLNAKMQAVEDAEAKNGAFPLLVWSMRYGTVAYQNMLSEFLAGHGYIVAFPEAVPNGAYPWQLGSPAEKKAALVQELSDINKSIDYLKRLQNVNPTKIGLLSWSYAGESAMLTQMNNPDIDVVVGLSSIGFSNGVYLGDELAGEIDIEKINVPYLMLFEQVAPNGRTRTLPDLFDALHADSRYVSFREMAHGNFNVVEGMVPGVLRTDKVQPWSTGGELAQIAYETICNLTVLFLDMVFKETDFESFDAHSSAMQVDLPEGFITVFSPQKK
ncbi:MAG: hypothetical protein KDD15_23040 [Lewinella sp.]|nr:hypothetical protein [Lewinella sp.]